MFAGAKNAGSSSHDRPDVQESISSQKVEIKVHRSGVGSYSLCRKDAATAESSDWHEGNPGLVASLGTSAEVCAGCHTSDATPLGL